jgi:hypothetical protein
MTDKPTHPRAENPPTTAAGVRNTIKTEWTATELRAAVGQARLLRPDPAERAWCWPVLV